MGRNVRKPVLEVSDKVRLKLVSSATETRNEILLVASLNMVLSKKPIAKVLIRLPECAGWSVPLLFRDLPRQVFSRRGPYVDGKTKDLIC